MVGLSCDTLRSVIPEQFYAVVDGEVIALELDQELPSEFLTAIPTQLDSVLDTPSLTIGGWDNTTEGPLVLALASNGQLISVIAVNPQQLDSLGETLTSIDHWLSTMVLRDLSELSGNTVEFYEGLLDLSPDASMMISPRRRYVLVTGLGELDTSALSDHLPSAEFEVRYLDILRAPGGPAIVRQRTSRSTQAATAPPQESEPIANFAPVDIPRVTVAPAPDIPEEIEPLPEEVERILAEPGGSQTLQILDDEPEPDAETVSEAAVAPEPEMELAEPDLMQELDMAEELDLDIAEEPDLTQEPDLAEDLDLDIEEELDVAEAPYLAHEPDMAHEAGVQTVTWPDPVDISAPDPADEPEPFIESEPVIDLTTDEGSVTQVDERPARAGDVEVSQVHVVPGATYDLDVLPMLFDADGETLESISNEMFAVEDSIVIVVSLPDKRRDTPFEDRRKFRWDTSLDRIQLLNDHSFTSDGRQRIVHLFVESARQPGFAAYVGELSRTAFQTQTKMNAETAWFSISPSLSNDLYRIFRKGRLPQHANITV